MDENPVLCSTSSHRAKEQLFGTATRTDYWLALEVPQTWGRKAFEESDLPAAVKTHLSTALKTKANTRLQVIKKGSGFAGDGIAFFIAANHEEKPNLYEFRLKHYEDLLDLDISGVLAERKEFWRYDRKEPLFLVCTNVPHAPGSA